MAYTPDSSTIIDAFTAGKGVEFILDPEDTDNMHSELAKLGEYLSRFPAEDSFAWGRQNGPPIRYSCWLAGRAGEDFISTADELSSFDGDAIAGKRGLELLHDRQTRDLLAGLKRRADISLKAAALAIGVSEDYLSKCSTRYRVINYQGDRAGIGTHFDGNGLSALLTDQPGLHEIRYDGTTRDVDPNAISVMPGSSVHRLTRDREHPYLPTFHAVKLGAAAVKTSMAAFWNLPDKTTIPGSLLGGADFYHDINAMKNDDGPDGSLRYLWRTVAEAHDISVEDLAEGRL